MAQVRRGRILDLAAEHGSVRVSDLSERFGVRPETIRRELNRLVEQGRLMRCYGGAVLPTAAEAAEMPFDYRAGLHRGAKESIAAVAATLVDDGDVLALDASSTSLALALELSAQGPRPLTILTNGAELPLRVGAAPGVTVVCTGGTLRPPSQSYVGPQTLRALEAYRVRKAFLSCQGFPLPDGPSDPTEAEAEVKAALVRTAERTVLLADQSKWGTQSLSRICPLDALADVVTDREPRPEHRAALAAAGIAVHVARNEGDGELRGGGRDG